MALNITTPIDFIFRVSQGCDVEQPFEIKDASDGSAIDLTGFTGQFVWKRAKGDATALLDISTNDVSPNSRVAIVASTGTVTIIIVDADTSTIGDQVAGGVYEVVLTDSAGIKDCLANSTMRVTKAV